MERVTGSAGARSRDGRIDKVEITKLAKRYGTERALVNVSLELRAGAMTALLGHNGAGKTTLLGILSTLVRQNDGKVRYVAGEREVEADALRREIGLLVAPTANTGHRSSCRVGGQPTATSVAMVRDLADD